MTRREGKTKRSGTGRIKRGRGGYWNRGDEKAERALFGRKVIRNRHKGYRGGLWRKRMDESKEH